ncbi:MAG: cysteine hydrolase [Bacteroidales bacterium]|jgi:nicotinamidase-related amidase|nr:cysteine hydrolase [Bacteroidales bacterium]
MKKVLIVVDMQNDFCTGSLSNKTACDVSANIAKLIKQARDNGMSVIYTRDTHDSDYLTTMEGKKLPVVHCVKGTDGWNIIDSLKPLPSDTIIDKKHFGYDDWQSLISPGDEVWMCGTCTDICVVSNALIIKAIDNVSVTVFENCCAGTTVDNHDAAIQVMRMCQCEIENV